MNDQLSWVLETKEKQLMRLFDTYPHMKFSGKDMKAVEYEFSINTDHQVEIGLFLRCPYSYPFDKPELRVKEKYKHKFLKERIFVHPILDNWKATHQVTLLEIVKTFISVIQSDPLVLISPNYWLYDHLGETMSLREYYELLEEYANLKHTHIKLSNKAEELALAKIDLISAFTQIVIRNVPGKGSKDIFNFLAPDHLFKDNGYIDYSKVRIYSYINTQTNENFIIKMNRLPFTTQERDLKIKLAQSEFITMMHCLHSDYIIRPISLGINDEYIGLMMEDGGKPLNYVYFKEPHIPEKLFLLAFLDLLNGLQFFNSENIYHGDIKPQNILMQNIEDKQDLIILSDTHQALNLMDNAYKSSHKTKLGPDISSIPRTHKFRYIDFGAAIQFPSTEAFYDTFTVRHGLDKLIELTLSYMAPEVIWPLLKKHHKKIDIKYNKIDIYSLALTMYSVIMQRYLSKDEVNKKASSSQYKQFLRTIKENMREKLNIMKYAERKRIIPIIMRCLDSNPKNRSNVNQVIESLLPLLHKYIP